jgi:thiol-disulfide isomerase/thioredoxin
MGALQGTPVLLNLWATWCAPCVREMPLLDAIAADYGDRLRVLTVSQDLQGASVVQPYFARSGFAHLEPWMDPENELGFALGGGVLPTTVLYNEIGQEVWRVQGDFDWSGEEARAAIDEALAAS